MKNSIKILCILAMTFMLGSVSVSCERDTQESSATDQASIPLSKAYNL